MNLKIKVKIFPKSSVNAVIGFENDILIIKVTAVPEKGLANKSVVNLLSKTLKIPKSSITILKGETTQIKIIQLTLGNPSQDNKMIQYIKLQLLSCESDDS